MLLTISTIRQLPQAIALGDSFCQHDSTGQPLVLIGLVDDISRLPTGFHSPYPILPVQELLDPAELETLSALYTPTEFAAACKPLFISETFNRFPQENKLLYADPNIIFLAPLAPVWDKLNTENTILTPFITHSPKDSYWPDEKFFQNIGLYSSDFIAFRRSAETDRLLSWWDDRVRQRAQLDFCQGLCLDQLWLMHVPVFFKNVAVVRHPGWHVGIWNLFERTLYQKNTKWFVYNELFKEQPLQFFNSKGLLHPKEGFFTNQNRTRLSDRADVTALMTAYRESLIKYQQLPVDTLYPAYGKQPEPIILTGWRYTARRSVQQLIRFLDEVYVPVFN